MRKINLSTILIGSSLGMVFLAIVCVGAAGIALLRHLADEQALARVRLAGISAVEAVERSGDRLLTSARLLAERPTLARLLTTGQADELSGFLGRFQQTSRLSGCSVVFEDVVYAQGGTSHPWHRVVAQASAAEGWFILHPVVAEPPLMVAWARVPSHSTAMAMVARVLDEDFGHRTGHKVGLPVVIRGREEVEGDAMGDRAGLNYRALEEKTVVAARLSPSGPYVAAVPLGDPSRRIAGVIEVSLATDEVDTSLKRLTRNLLMLAVAVVALATVLSLWLARRIAGPIELLTNASARIGRGDLSSPVPHVSGLETGALSETMEEMRERILQLMSELRRKRAEAEAVLSGIVEGVFSVDRERRIRYLNPQAAALLDITPHDAIGRFCGDVLRPQGPGGIRPCDDNCPILHARFRGSTRSTEHLLLAEGRRRSVVVTSAPPSAQAEDRGAGDAHQFQVIRDETEVEAARRLRDTVLANISHEFRTPLSAQLASLELLRDQLPDLESGEIQELVLSIERGTLRLTRLIDNLLESTRIEAGQDSLRRQKIALDDVVEEAVGLMAPLVDQRQQQLEVNLPYPLPAVNGDATRLVQVFVNLLANANKFAPAASTIRVGGSVADREVTIWVEDEGPGLPDGAVDTLFQRFRRSSGEEPVEGGMGLGLYIVKSIVDRHGGRMEVQEKAKGTRMDVILPCGGKDEDPSRR
jgi:signal transduction histidine kinase